SRMGAAGPGEEVAVRGLGEGAELAAEGDGRIVQDEQGEAVLGQQPAQGAEGTDGGGLVSAGGERPFQRNPRRRIWTIEQHAHRFPLPSAPVEYISNSYY